MEQKPVLSEEIAFFEEILPTLLKDSEGKAVLIKGRNVAGIFETVEDAIGAGAKQFGLEPHLVRCILPVQPDPGLPAVALALLAQPSLR